MKKIAAFLITCLLITSGIAACGQKSAVPNENTQPIQTESASAEQTALIPEPSESLLVFPGAAESGIPNDIEQVFTANKIPYSKGYLVPASYEDVMTWYQKHMTDWQLNDEMISPVPDLSKTVSGVQYFKKDSQGILIYVHGNLLKDETLFVIAYGPWSDIDSCKVLTTENFANAPEVQPDLAAGPKRGESSNYADQAFKSLTVSQSDPDVIYIGSEGNGIFRSLDGGGTWKWLRTGLHIVGGDSHSIYAAYPEIYDILIIPGDGSKVLALTTVGPGPAEGNYPSALAGIYKSNDGGEAWEQRNTGILNNALTSFDFCLGDVPTVYLVTGSGIATFTGSDVDGRFFEGSIYKSTDEGDSWIPLALPEGMGTYTFNKVIVRGQSPAPTVFTNALKNEYQKDSPHVELRDETMGLIKSTDDGKTWTEINPQGSFIIDFDVAENNTDLIYAVDRGMFKMYRSNDGGSHWKMMDFPAAGPVRISPFNSQIVFFSLNESLCKSIDGLNTFQTVLKSEEFIDDIEFCHADPNIVYVATRGLQVYKSEDGGDSFKLVANLRQFIDDNTN